PVGYKCAACGAVWADEERWAACERTEWRPEGPFRGTAGFWISHLYSPWKRMAAMVADYLDRKEDRQRYKVFVNTTLAELWEEQGDTPDDEILLGRREEYPANDQAVVPTRGLFLTCAVDVQENPPRLEYEVVAWGRNRENWSIAYGAVQATASNGQALPVTSPELWEKLDREVLQREWQHESGQSLPILAMGIDTGSRPQPVYEFAKRHAQPVYSAAGLKVAAPRTVVPLKGVKDEIRVISKISKEDAARKRQNVRIVSIGTHRCKQELYDDLRDSRPRPDGSASPRCHHFPQAYGSQYFEGLCSEKRVLKASGDVSWQKVPGRRNEPLDLKVYNRACYAIVGGDRFNEAQWASFEEAVAPAVAEPESEPEPSERLDAEPETGGWLGSRTRNWLRR